MVGESQKAGLSVVGRPRQLRLRIVLADSDREAASAVLRTADSNPSICLKYVPHSLAARAYLEEQCCDLLVIDPLDLADFDFIREVKERHPWLATMIMSHSRSWQFGSAAASCKIDGLVGKPVAPADLLRQALPLAETAYRRRRRGQRRVLAIGAHPDDVEIGCAGSLARHRAEGDIVHILTLSRGGGGGDIGVRTAEAHHAAKILGASLTLGNIPDGRITEGMETIRIIKEVVDDVEPTHVYTHSLDDTHQDHRAAHAASVVAARAVPNVYCYNGASSTVAFIPNLFVEITDFIELKLRALDAYESQAERVPALQHDNVVAAARHWGRFAKYALVEPFRILRQVDQDAARRARRLDVSRALLEAPLCASQSAAD